MAGRKRTRKVVLKQTYEDAGTQTTPDERDTEIMRLKESIELLLQENLQLKKKGTTTVMKDVSNNIIAPRKLENIALPDVNESPRANKIVGKGCNCKGKCASKVCGCVKRNIPCSEFCKCNDSTCQNQEPDKENIGDPNSQSQLSRIGEQALQSLATLKLRDDKQMSPAGKAASSSSNQLNEAVKVGKSLFSPDYSQPDETEFSLSELEVDHIFEFDDVKKMLDFNSDISPEEKDNSKPSKGKRKVTKTQLDIPEETETQAEGSSSDKPKKKKLLSPFYNGAKPGTASSDTTREKSESPVGKKNIGKRRKAKPKEQVSSTQKTPSPGVAAKMVDFDDELEFSTIDPMKPTRQLARTPIRGSPPDEQLQISEASVSTTEKEIEEEQLEPPEGIEAPIVDWEKHCAQLVPCKLCRRKFYPHRLSKHEASCKKV